MLKHIRDRLLGVVSGNRCFERRRIDAWKAAHPRQPALFELRLDSRPAAERVTSRRYAELSLFTILE